MIAWRIIRPQMSLETDALQTFIISLASIYTPKKGTIDNPATLSCVEFLLPVFGSN
jgi:hypothetical protein